ncbi:MAG TPA: N-acetyl-alpha-D-glucosaminyl L-malate synthase BshA [Vicinamibacterales bacterium]|jgi:N-acetyl-alpha-D-glucosaminyl L-malate synthase BshA|nr:N-acetyl-alpha-D-glucosaminyl L-malate synthase BshA [Vicinamibacterales bacterium]
MNIAVVCYASVGGSGIVATELAKSLARRHHQVHLISTEPPFRLGDYEAGLAFHRVHTPSYPLFREPQYLLSLATQIVHLSREFAFDIVHAHYAIPHATAAYLARQILASTPGAHVPKVMTTLHGTDITLLGSDPSYSETVAFSIEQSDGVTAVSESLKRDTYQSLPLTHDIRVIPNFLECDDHCKRDLPDLRARLCPPDRYDKLIIHLSNFRPVKRVEAVVEIFDRVKKQFRAKLIFVGDGPELNRAMRMVHERGLACDVEALGEQDQVVPLLSVSDLFLLPSAQESFGLAALEAMACGVPVVASRVGGLPEVVEDGVSGYLRAPEDVDGMADAALALLTNPELHRQFAKAALDRVRLHFCAKRVVPQYEAYYQEITRQ